MVIRPETSIIEGDSVQIVCNVIASRQKPSRITVHLTKGLEVKSSGERSTSYNKTVLANDSGVYECKSVMGNVQKSVNRSVTVSGEKNHTRLFAVVRLGLVNQGKGEMTAGSLGLVLPVVIAENLCQPSIGYCNAISSCMPFSAII